MYNRRHPFSCHLPRGPAQAPRGPIGTTEPKSYPRPRNYMVIPPKTCTRISFSACGPSIPLVHYPPSCVLNPPRTLATPAWYPNQGTGRKVTLGQIRRDFLKAVGAKRWRCRVSLDVREGFPRRKVRASRGIRGRDGRLAGGSEGPEGLGWAGQPDTRGPHLWGEEN